MSSMGEQYAAFQMTGADPSDEDGNERVPLHLDQIIDHPYQPTGWPDTCGVPCDRPADDHPDVPASPSPEAGG
jgi:hypothetical protein